MPGAAKSSGISSIFSMIILPLTVWADLSVAGGLLWGEAGPLGKPRRKALEWSGTIPTCIQELRSAGGWDIAPTTKPPKATVNPVSARMAEFG